MCIIAHANPLTFGRLVGALDHPRISVFCHIDARADQSRFAQAAGNLATFLPERRKNYWGAFTQVETALDLFAFARREGPFQSYLLISGDSLPVVTNELLLQVVENWPTVVRFREQFPGDHIYQRVSNIYIPTTRIGAFRVGNHLERYLVPADLEIVPRALKTRVLKDNIDFRVWKGSQWICLSDEHLSQLMEFVAGNPDFVELFRFSAIPDELFFQTVLKIIDPEVPSSAGLMEQDWHRKPKPFTLRAPGEIDLVRQAKRPFFRKFCDEGLELVDLVLADRSAHSGAGAGRHNLWEGFSQHYSSAAADVEKEYGGDDVEEVA